MGKKDNGCSQIKCDQKKVYNKLKNWNYPTEDIDCFFSPTIKNGKFFNIFDYMVISVLCITYSIYMLTYFDTISWQLSSIGRIIMINSIPFYDWRHLKNKYCVIEKSSTNLERTYECGLCENIRKIDFYQNMDEEFLDANYIHLDNPVILTDVLENWSKDSKFIKHLQEDEEFSNSYPCRISTNVMKQFNDIGEVLAKLEHFGEFYLHFQNCELEAMRVLRKYTFRPKAIPRSHSPTLYNWIIWNKNWNITHFKSLQLVEKLTVVGQLFGSTYVRLVPRKNCEILCPTLEVKLLSREILVFTDLWDLQYRTYEIGENMAAVLEIRD